MVVDGARGGSVDAGACVHAVDTLSDEAIGAARSRLAPAAGVMLSALWVAGTRQLLMIIHHLAIDAVSWRIVLDDLNTAWGQHRDGRDVVLPATGASFARWASLLAEHARRPAVLSHARSGVGWRRCLARCRRCGRRWIPLLPRRTCRCCWMWRPPECCWAMCPRRFTLGCKTSC